MSGSISPLDKPLRGQLERTVARARQIAEQGARAALGQLAVNQKQRPAWLSDNDNALRLALRAHGRQLGDALNGGSVQAMARLVEETAYEHWHRMLFGRFLAENGLLMYADPDDPDNPVPVSLEECMELAADPGVASAWNVKNGWQLAARMAAMQLPQIFNVDSPVFQLGFAPEHQQKLEKLLAGLPPAVFTAADSLGWVYQFWQSEAKDMVNKAEVKIGSRQLPAVTQLFTEAYMVDFLLDNTLGAWLAARKLADADWQNAQSEDELRQKASIPGAPLNCLRFVKTASGWRAAAGNFPDWPDSLADFRLLDPCCGSGHFPVSALRMLAAMRMACEGLAPREAVARVLEQNLFGLELDPRCVKLAAFALAFAAWTWTPPGCEGPLGFFQLPKLNIACSGTPVTADREKWLAIAPPNSRLRNALALLHEEFKNAQTLGSLIEPESSEVRPDPQELREALAKALASESSDADDLRETAVAAAGIALATEILARKYSLIATNVPYLARGKQAEELKDFCERKYPRSRQDIATVFLERCLRLCAKGGTCALVMPQNWLFLGAYKKLREELLKQDSWNMLARLGPGAFETISGEVVKAILIILSNLPPTQATPLLEEKARPQLMAGLDVSGLPNAEAKARGLIEAEIMEAEQARQLENPDYRVAFGEANALAYLKEYAYSHKGLSTGDIGRYVFKFWEITDYAIWHFYIQNANSVKHFDGRTDVICWGENGRIIYNASGAFIKGR
ncbi:MAG: SAM-dependent DNA methyltransferase, partial [Desulfovibrio sp.]|nr:SAM-dependent DNA methyltransferase [Desulfovibrio sp.]